MVIDQTINHNILELCQRKVDQSKSSKAVDSYDEDMIEDGDFYEMLGIGDMYEEYLEYHEEMNTLKKKKKKKQLELSPEELAKREEEKAVRKVQKEAIKQAHHEAKILRQKEKEARKAEERRLQAEATSIELAARKEYLLSKLDRIDISKKKSVDKITAINIELLDIDNELKYIESEFGIHANIKEGSKVKRFFRKTKNIFHRIVKKTKKFIRNNSELIFGLSSVILPVIGGYIFKLVTK